jgi:alcohol dehydrogenase class IV
MTTVIEGRFNYPTAYRIGPGRARELAAACRELGLTRPLVVTDPGVRSLPWFTAMISSLAADGIESEIFSEIAGNPTEEHVNLGVERYRTGKHVGVVLVGGGSAMDVGKCIALLANNPGGVFDYEDVGDNYKRADPDEIVKMIAIPTTAGTGSEVGRCSVITDLRDHSKKIIFHAKMQPSLVLADPELTAALPPGLTAATGMDALAHCFEALSAPAYHPMADGIAFAGMELIRDHLPAAFKDGSNLAARTHMLMAASMGATAFQKGLGLVHAWSHPLGGVSGIHHGTANAIFLPYVMVENRKEIEPKMERLARFLGLEKPGFDGVLEWMLALRKEVGMPHTLAGQSGVTREMGKELAPMAAADPSLGSNPKPCSLADLQRVFEKAYDGDLT